MEMMSSNMKNDDDVKELKDALQKIDPNYSKDVQLWNHFCPTLIGRGVCIPETKDGALRAQVLAPMLHLIKDTSDPNNSLKPEATRKQISDDGLIFEDLKKELSKLKS
eukprot:3049718-Ditylum_brightwellii.AAC.1